MLRTSTPPHQAGLAGLGWLVAWTGFLVLVLVGLYMAGGGPLAPPPVFHPEQLRSWLQDRSALDAGFSMLRLAAGIAAGYLLVATLAGALARLCGAVRAVSLLNTMSPQLLRNLLAVTSAASLTVALPRAVAAPQAVPASGAIAASGNQAPPVPAVAVSPPPTAVLVAPPRFGTTLAPHPQEPMESAVAPATPLVWTVRSGDNLWSIAKTTLTTAWGRPPTDPELEPYWVSVISANRDRLSDPLNPDLIFPGQEFLLPQTPAPS